MSDLLRRTLAASIKIEMNLASDLGWARVDANQLDSAILNLAINSRDAMPDGGTLMIETANIVIDDGSIGTPKGLEAGRYVMVAVIDTGVGMPGDILSRVFEPFFTTKGIGQGTGLGLSQVYGFVKQSGGQVDIVSKVGHGTTVRLFFPRLEFTGDLAQGPDESPPNGRHGGKETIVVVEDDDHVRDYATLILNELGYRVLEAHDAETALGILDSESEISLIFTDIGLVGPLNGYQLMEAARRRKPSLKCLLTTGYVREAVTNRRNSDAKVDLIGKPFSYDELARKIRRVLDRIEQK
jgi:CheY-like chemotaxis protein